MSYQVGETIRLTAAVTNIAGSAVDPVTMKIAINKPNGVVAGSAINMEKEETGVYCYDYLIPDNTGVYRYKTTAVGADDRITIVKDTFSVEIPI